MPDSLTPEVFHDLPDAEATDALAARYALAFADWHRNTVDPVDPATSALTAASALFRLAPRGPGLQVQLHGDLGAGKTAFARATLRALGYAGRVRSPTYTLVEPYEISLATSSAYPADKRALRVNHFDLYRFSSADEWREAGFDEYLDQHALNLIEWPERAATLLGCPDLSLHIDVAGDDGRRMRVFAFSEAGKNCLEMVAAAQPRLLDN